MKKFNPFYENRLVMFDSPDVPREIASQEAEVNEGKINESRKKLEMKGDDAIGRALELSDWEARLQQAADVINRRADYQEAYGNVQPRENGQPESTKKKAMAVCEKAFPQLKGKKDANHEGELKPVNDLGDSEQKFWRGILDQAGIRDGEENAEKIMRILSKSMDETKLRGFLGVMNKYYDTVKKVDGIYR